VCEGDPLCEGPDLAQRENGSAPEQKCRTNKREELKKKRQKKAQEKKKDDQ
jgi:hypothetical protein